MVFTLKGRLIRPSVSSAAPPDGYPGSPTHDSASGVPPQPQTGQAMAGCYYAAGVQDANPDRADPNNRDPNDPNDSGDPNEP